MSEGKSELVKSSIENRSIGFIDKAYDDLDAMKGFAQLLIDSKLIPNHFYGKKQVPGVNGQMKSEVDYEKGNLAAVITVLIQGGQLGLNPMTALQHIVPVNGMTTIKGDMAKALIFNSGKLKKGSWIESSSGSIQSQDYEVTISATREDNGVTLSRSFSVTEAKRAGLWITDQQATGQEGWKYKLSPWYRYQSRMITYRVIGFIARDLFSDVLNGMVTTEEAGDYVQDQAEIINLPNGNQAILPDKREAQSRSEKLNQTAHSKLKENQFAPVQEDKPPIQGIEDIKEIPGDQNGGIQQEFAGGLAGDMEGADQSSVQNGKENNDADLQPGTYSLKQLSEMETASLLKIVEDKTEMVEAMTALPGKNTSKKLREIINAFQNGHLESFVNEILSSYSNGGQTAAPTQRADGMGGIEPNTSFDSSGMTNNASQNLDKPTVAELTGIEIEIPPFNKGQERDFMALKKLFDNLNHINPVIGNERFMELRGMIPEFSKFPNKENFCKFATIEEVCLLLTKNV